jgi:hypothetical protein
MIEVSMITMNCAAAIKPSAHQRRDDAGAAPSLISYSLPVWGIY